MIYYGRKKLRDKNGNVVAEVVDKNNYRGQIKVDAFSDVDENRYFEYSWEGIDSTSSFLGEAMFSANVVATALSVAGTVNLWNPAGWASLTAAQTLKIATTLVGVVSLASSDMPSSGEWVKVTTYGAMVIRDKNGEKVLELMEPSDDVKQIEELITFSETGSGADNAETGSDTNNWNLSTQDTTFSVKVGDMLNVYTSGSIQAGSPTGTAIPFAPTGYAVEATLNFDVSEDPTIRVFE